MPALNLNKTYKRFSSEYLKVNIIIAELLECQPMLGCEKGDSLVLSFEMAFVLEPIHYQWYIQERYLHYRCYEDR